MSAALLSSLSDLFYEHGAMLDWPAVADAKRWLMIDYIYDDCVMMKYHAVHAVLHSRTLTDVLAHAACILACSCAFVEYLLCSVGRLAV